MHPLEFIKRYRQWANLRIHRRLMIWSVGFWVISITLLSLTVLWIGQTRMINETARRNTQLAAIISRDINSQVNETYSNARTFTQHLSGLNSGLNDQAQAILSLRLSSPKSYSAIYYFGDQENLLFALTDISEHLAAITSTDILSRPAINTDSKVTDVYRRVGNGTYISDVAFAGIERKPVVYIGLPLNFSDGQKRVVIYEINLDNIWQSIDLITIGQTGIAYVVSHNGIIIAHPDRTYIERQIPVPLEPVLSNYEGSAEYEDSYSNKRVLAAYSPIGGQLGWGVVVQQDLDEAHAAVSATAYWSLGIWFVLGIIGTIGILLMIRNFTRPIVRLTGTARQIAETGDITIAPEMQSPDEVGQMSHAFGQMIDRLKTAKKELINSEEKYRSLFANALDAIWLIRGNSIIDCNDKAQELFGCERSQLIGRTPYDFSPEQQPGGEDSKKKVSRIINLASSGKPQLFEWQNKTCDGTLFEAEISLNRIDTGEGPIMMAIISDITERKRAQRELNLAHEELEQRVEQRTTDLRNTNTLLQQEIIQRREIEEKLRQSETKYRDLVENANSIILEMDTQGNIIYFNPFAQQFFGYTEEEILGRNAIGTIVPAVDTSGNDLQGLINDLTHNPGKYYNSENENMKSNGERVWVAWTNKGHYGSDDKLSHILCIGIDRTEQKYTANLLSEQARSEATIAERTRLARDLHDAVSQTLFSASLIAEVLPRIWEKNRAEGLKRLEEIRQLTRGALAEMRTLLFELRPAALADAELKDLLRHLTDSVSGRNLVPISLQVEGDCKLPPDVKIALYRIAQEALNNVGKHSGASSATVTLYCQPERLTLHIADNGHGFEIEKTSSGSFGLDIMRERANSIGAILNIESKINEGTEVMVIWQDNKEEMI
jgi:PAS domain S-box-containing protein